MPWVFLIQGTALRVATDSPYALEDRFLESEAYQQACERANSNGYLLKFGCNVEGPSEFCVMVGKDLYPGRHIYQGLTVTAPLAEVEGSAELNAIVESLVSWFQNEAGLLPAVEHGVVLNQFD